MSQGPPLRCHKSAETTAPRGLVYCHTDGCITASHNEQDVTTSFVNVVPSGPQNCCASHNGWSAVQACFATTHWTTAHRRTILLLLLAAGEVGSKQRPTFTVFFENLCLKNELQLD